VPAAPLPDSGEYLTRAAGCTDCHTVTPERAFAGGLHIETPFGVFVTPNITPDKATGIGSWTFEDFQRALRDGVSPSGALYYPAFPYRSYSKMTDADMRKIWNYLTARPALTVSNSSNRLSFPFDQRWLLRVWRALFLRGPSGDHARDIKVARGPFVPDPERTRSWNRGAYLVEALLHCAECHTPRNRLGAPEVSLWMAGSDVPIGAERAPNITPDRFTGTGAWTIADWTRFLASGIDPRGNFPGGEMAQVVQNTSALTEADRAAVVEYLMTLKPIRRDGYDR
jgi:mono/diheme cytochrome c family protein